MRVLEVSRLGLFKGLNPDETEWIRWGSSLTADEPVRPETPSMGLLARTLSRIRRREFDLIVLPAIHPEHVHNQSRPVDDDLHQRRAGNGQRRCRRRVHGHRWKLSPRHVV